MMTDLQKLYTSTDSEEIFELAKGIWVNMADQKSPDVYPGVVGILSAVLSKQNKRMAELLDKPKYLS